MLNAKRLLAIPNSLAISRRDRKSSTYGKSEAPNKMILSDIERYFLDLEIAYAAGVAINIVIVVVHKPTIKLFRR